MKNYSRENLKLFSIYQLKIIAKAWCLKKAKRRKSELIEQIYNHQKNQSLNNVVKHPLLLAEKAKSCYAKPRSKVRQLFKTTEEIKKQKIKQKKQQEKRKQQRAEKRKQQQALKDKRRKLKAYQKRKHQKFVRIFTPTRKKKKQYFLRKYRELGELSSSSDVDTDDFSSDDDSSSSHDELEQLINDIKQRDWVEAIFKNTPVLIVKWQWDADRPYVQFKYKNAKTKKLYKSHRSKFHVQTKAAQTIDEFTEMQLHLQNEREYPDTRLWRALMETINWSGCPIHGDEIDNLELKTNCKEKKAELICVECDFQTIASMKLPKKFRKHGTYLKMCNEARSFAIDENTQEDETDTNSIKSNVDSSCNSQERLEPEEETIKESFVDEEETNEFIEDVEMNDAMEPDEEFIEETVDDEENTSENIKDVEMTDAMDSQPCRPHTKQTANFETISKRKILSDKHCDGPHRFLFLKLLEKCFFVDDEGRGGYGCEKHHENWRFDHLSLQLGERTVRLVCHLCPRKLVSSRMNPTTLSKLKHNVRVWLELQKMDDKENKPLIRLLTSGFFKDITAGLVETCVIKLVRRYYGRKLRYCTNPWKVWEYNRKLRREREDDEKKQQDLQQRFNFRQSVRIGSAALDELYEFHEDALFLRRDLDVFHRAIIKLVLQTEPERWKWKNCAKHKEEKLKLTLVGSTFHLQCLACTPQSYAEIEVTSPEKDWIMQLVAAQHKRLKKKRQLLITGLIRQHHINCLTAFYIGLIELYYKSLNSLTVNCDFDFIC